MSLGCRPGTGVGDVEMIAAFFWRKLGAGLLRDEIAKGGLSALEGAVIGGPVCDAFVGLIGYQR